MMVKEPAGTVCSLRNWRTTGGGMLLGDTPAADGGEKLQGHTAVYVCPKGFSGNYQALVRRVWGKVTTGKVLVEVVTHFGTPQAKRQSRNLSLDQGEALVKFDLADGRRTAPLGRSVVEQQVLNAAATQVAINQQQRVLADQMAAMDDPLAAAAWPRPGPRPAASAPAVKARAARPASSPACHWPIPCAGPWATSPSSSPSPRARSSGATGVVSADRRYVRITCYPLFSRISDVHTFSMDSGATQTTNGIGTGGGL